MPWLLNVLWILCAKTSTIEEERLGLVTGDSTVNQSAPQLSPYDEDDYGGSPDSYDYDDDVKPFADEKATRYGRGITGSPPRGRAGSGSSSGHEQGLGIRGAVIPDHEDDRQEWDETSTPPRPPPHRGDSGTGSGAGAHGTPVSGRGTPRGAFL